MKTLEDMRAKVDRAAHDILSHEVLYDGRTVKVQGSYLEGSINGQGSVGIQQDMEFMILRADVPVRPGPANRLRFPRLGNSTYAPTNVMLDETGAYWLFNVKKVLA